MSTVKWSGFGAVCEPSERARSAREKIKEQLKLVHITLFFYSIMNSLNARKRFILQ